MLKCKRLTKAQATLIIMIPIPSEKFLRTDLTRAQPKPRSEAGVTWTLLRPRGTMWVHLTTLRPMIILPGVAPPSQLHNLKYCSNKAKSSPGMPRGPLCVQSASKTQTTILEYKVKNVVFTFKKHLPVYKLEKENLLGQLDGEVVVQLQVVRVEVEEIKGHGEVIVLQVHQVKRVHGDESDHDLEDKQDQKVKNLGNNPLPHLWYHKDVWIRSLKKR